jgi:hypothetical protein
MQQCITFTRKIGKRGEKIKWAKQITTQVWLFYLGRK